MDDGFFANRTSLLLILLIVALVVIAIPVGGELYARHVASTKVANAVQCEVQDSAKVSFSPAPPVLWQYLNKNYSDISVQTAGNQVRQAKGMTVKFDVRDIKLNNTANSQGTDRVDQRHGRPGRPTASSSRSRTPFRCWASSSLAMSPPIPAPAPSP